MKADSFCEKVFPLRLQFCPPQPRAAEDALSLHIESSSVDNEPLERPMINDEKSKLIAENARLVKENAELRAKLAAYLEKSELGLDQESWKILVLLYEATGPLTVEQIVTRCNFSSHLAEHHLSILKARSLISTHTLPAKESGAGDTVAYLISPIGSGFVVKHKK